ncbi:PREDICTED: uncharacterized protein LOC108564897 [Nicrophorus vespilloides]|uniref:Uncharacterized protein LOC108564897 n=1 Tax=Nicrophorus vespilloides TaxID=110193 RepID=A0ABM1MYD6_NICVS|nr:PREDICTED: uncharacterized protein LOC108564897 [Nicrophorus vespilloides]
MAKLCFLLAALFVFSTIAYAQAEPVPSFDLARSQRWLMEKNVRASDVEKVPETTEVTPGESTETEETGGFLQSLRKAIFFIPKMFLNSVLRMIEAMLKWMN